MALCTENINRRLPFANNSKQAVHLNLVFANKRSKTVHSLQNNPVDVPFINKNPSAKSHYRAHNISLKYRLPSYLDFARLIIQFQQMRNMKCAKVPKLTS